MYLSIWKKKKVITPLLSHALCISFPPVPQPSLFELIEYINCDRREETLRAGSLGLLSRVMSYSSRFLITTPRLPACQDPRPCRGSFKIVCTQ